jgi:hypothetical protein
MRGRLSDAIRRGAKMRPQVYGKLYADGRTCAWGAALDGIGQDASMTLSSPEMICMHFWPHLYNYGVQWPGNAGFWPVPPGKMVSFVGAIVALNDTANWTREKIADWVEQMENQLTPPQALLPAPMAKVQDEQTDALPVPVSYV